MNAHRRQRPRLHQLVGRHLQAPPCAVVLRAISQPPPGLIEEFLVLDIKRLQKRLLEHAAKIPKRPLLSLVLNDEALGRAEPMQEFKQDQCLIRGQGQRHLRGLGAIHLSVAQRPRSGAVLPHTENDQVAGMQRAAEPSPGLAGWATATEERSAMPLSRPTARARDALPRTPAISPPPLKQPLPGPSPRPYAEPASDSSLFPTNPTSPL